MNMRGIATYISTITCLDSLGLGALLALLLSTRRAAFSAKSILAAAIVFAAALARSLRYTDATIILHDTAQAGLFACIIAATAPGVGGFLGAVLLWPPLLYIGKISYGIYVYHPFMPEFVESAFHKMGMTVPERSLGNAAVSMLVTLVCASLSWRLLERPINELKRYF
jgi:peptidoglycan/LPS O-acetylase OafA/YrhL